MIAFFTVRTAGGQVTFNTLVNTRDLGREDYVEVTYAVENAAAVGTIQAPDFSGFIVVHGPSQSTGMTVINGSMTQSKAISYVLQPKSTGRLTIKGGTAIADGKTLHSAPVSVMVRATGGGGATSHANPLLPDAAWPGDAPEVEMEELLRPGENVNDKIKQNFFLKVELSKPECFVGEPVIATYKLYSRLHGDSRVTKHPSLNGFSVYDMLDPSQDQTSVEKVNAKNFTVHLIRKSQLVPLQAGDVPLDAVELDNNLYFLKTNTPKEKGDDAIGGLLDRFLNRTAGTSVTEHFTLESKPVTLHVKPLPETGKPADFGGAVGQYTVKAKLDNDKLDTGDAAVLTVTIKGTGNLPLVNAPVVAWPPEIQSFDVSSKENIPPATAPLGGSKTFAFTFICTKPGGYTIPPVTLAYFDPAVNAYKTASSDSLQLKVTGTSKRRTHRPAVFVTGKAGSGGSLSLLWILGTVCAGGLLIWLLMRRSARSMKVRPVPAPPLPEVPAPAPKPDPLREARAHFAAEDYGKFYAAVNRAVWKSVSDKLGLPASELNKLNIAAGLRGEGWAEEAIMPLNNLLNECELRLYTPAYSSEDAERVMGEAVTVLASLA